MALESYHLAPKREVLSVTIKSFAASLSTNAAMVWTIRTLKSLKFTISPTLGRGILTSTCRLPDRAHAVSSIWVVARARYAVRLPSAVTG